MFREFVAAAALTRDSNAATVSLKGVDWFIVLSIMEAVKYTARTYLATKC